jgi:hypothetical protein
VQQAFSLYARYAAATKTTDACTSMSAHVQPCKIMRCTFMVQNSAGTKNTCVPVHARTVKLTGAEDGKTPYDNPV